MSPNLIKIENLLFEKAVFGRIEGGDEDLLEFFLTEDNVKKMRDHINNFTSANKTAIFKIDHKTAWQKVVLKIGL